MALETLFYLSPMQSQACHYTDQECLLLCDCYNKTDEVCLPYSSQFKTGSSGDISPCGCTRLHWGSKEDPSPRALVKLHSI